MSDRDADSVFRRVCEEFPGVVWLRPYDMSQITFINSDVEEAFGIDRQDIYTDADTYIEGIHPDDRAAYRSLLESVRDRALDDGVAERREIEYRLRKGKTDARFLETIFPVWNRDGALLLWAGFGQEITEQRNREEILQLQTDQLELLNQVVRHDIRNEVNLGLDIIRSAKRQGSIDEENLERVENILGHVAELTETARDMTEMITTLSDEPDPIQLAPTLKREVANISTVSEEATITLEDECPDVEVRVNELLSAVFRNLLTNAIQHSDRDDPTITISCTMLDRRVAVHIADDGPGIPDEKKELAFESGQTLVGSTGTGFGLSLVETLLEQYGGDIYLSDNEPRGSVFTVLLPLTDPTVS
jgi:signal transduction histidine kinase